MIKNIIIILSFVLSILLGLVGTLFKILHWPNADNLLMFALIATIIYIIFAIVEVVQAKKINHSEKTMWIIAFIFTTWIAGFVYFIIGRRRIVNKSKLNLN